MLTKSITALIANTDGEVLLSFQRTSPTEWADLHMKERYGHTVLESDFAQDSFPAACYRQLIEERKSLDSWFDDEGKLSPLLQSAFMVNKLRGPLADGMGWDFKPTGDPEPRMMLFKGTLIAVARSAALIPHEHRVPGNMQFGGLASMVRSAYTERAMLHTWRGSEQHAIDGAEMSRRWVAHMTFVFLLTLGAPREWAWDASKSHKVFGPVDEKGWV